MVERIEKIARVKSVDHDVGRNFKSKRDRDDGGGSFASELKRVLNKKTERKPSEIPEAYKLEITSAGTHSLFYFGGLNVRQLLS